MPITSSTITYFFHRKICANEQVQNSHNLLAVLLIASIGANVYFAGFMTAPNNKDTTKLGMVTALSQVQVNINAELQTIGTNAVLASQKLTSTGLTGT